MSAGERALVISPEAPYPPVGGGALRTASLIEYLAPRYALDLVLFREEGQPDPSEGLPEGHAHRVQVLPLPYHARDGLSRTLRNSVRALRNRPPLLDRFSGHGEAIAAFARGQRYALGLIEHFWCAPYLHQIAPHCARTVLNLHNIESEWQESVAQQENVFHAFALRRFGRRYRQLEAEWLPRFSTVLAPSNRNCELVRTIAPGANVMLYPNAIPEVPRPDRAEEQVIAFTGNLAYEPNVAAVVHFYTRVWPLLRTRIPGLRWRLIGKSPERVSSIVAGDERIELTGAVRDAVAELVRAKVAVVPVLSGSGTRMKILEAWAAGTPVISTKAGAEGLDANPGEHLLIVEQPEEFAEAVVFLLEAPEARAQLAEAGRCLYERRYTWPSAWKTLNLD